jgi:hypothetical protein
MHILVRARQVHIALVEVWRFPDMSLPCWLLTRHWEVMVVITTRIGKCNCHMRQPQLTVHTRVQLLHFICQVGCSVNFLQLESLSWKWDLIRHRAKLTIAQFVCTSICNLYAPVIRNWALSKLKETAKTAGVQKHGKSP